jgi:membrane protein
MDSPVDIHNRPQRPSRAQSIRAFLGRLYNKLDEDNAALLAGGIAMYGLLSVFPGLAAAVSIYGLFATPAEVIREMKVFAGVLPPGVWSIFASQLHNVVAHDHRTLTVAALVSLLFALWSARFTVSSLMTAINIAYRAQEHRGYVRQIWISLWLTVGVILGFLIMLLIGVVIPVALAVLGTSLWVQRAVAVLRAALLWAFAVTGLSTVYRFAPARPHARWRWLTWGSGVAATLWLALTGLFTLYVRIFAAYDRTYGPLAGVVVLLVWFYLLSFAVLLGAEIDSVRLRRAGARVQLRAVGP